MWLDHPEPIQRELKIVAFNNKGVSFRLRTQRWGIGEWTFARFAISTCTVPQIPVGPETFSWLRLEGLVRTHFYLSLGNGDQVVMVVLS